MFIHDIIKINYINEGYLPNYPYHMTTDREMIQAFIGEEGFFYDHYPNVADSLEDAYTELVNAIKSSLSEYLASGADIPDWVYSYMLGATIGPASQEEDISYLQTLLGIDSTEVLAQFDPETSQRCYEISEGWLKKLSVTAVTRPATMFGEPHVIKDLRLKDVSILS